MKTINKDIAPRERILSVASELFFHKGYRATGINEVIRKSGVAKATFYKHFPSKDDLCLAFLQDRNTTEYETVIAYLEDKGSPRERFMGVIEAIEPWLEAKGIRGCVFLNMVAEVPDPESPLRREGVSHYEKLKRLIRGLTQDLIESDRSRYGHLEVERVTSEYLILLAGAIALSEIYHDTWPVRKGVERIKNIIEKN